MDSGDKLVCICSKDGERPQPFACGVLPVLPYARDTEWRTILHRDSVGLLAALGRHPFVESVNRQDAAPAPVRFPEHRQPRDCFALGIDRLSPALRVLAPVGNEPPLEKVERAFSRLRILSDHEQFLARAAVPSTRIIVQPGVADIQSVHEGVIHRPFGLNDTSTHDPDMGVEVPLRHCRSPNFILSADNARRRRETRASIRWLTYRSSPVFVSTATLSSRPAHPPARKAG